MKRFWKGVLAWKTSVSLQFTGAAAIYLLFCRIFGRTETTNRMLWTLLLACMAGGLLQGLCFSDWVFKALRYTRRSLLFCALYLPVLALLAWLGGWFPMTHAGSWLLFLGIFLAIFAALTVGFECYYRIAGRRYDGLLGQYRRQREEKGE